MIPIFLYNHINSLPTGFCHLLTFFTKIFFSKNSGTLLEGQMVWILIRTDILSVLIWVKTVCKGYQQTTKVMASKIHDEMRHFEALHFGIHCKIPGP